MQTAPPVTAGAAGTEAVASETNGPFLWLLARTDPGTIAEGSVAPSGGGPADSDGDPADATGPTELAAALNMPLLAAALPAPADLPAQGALADLAADAIPVADGALTAEVLAASRLATGGLRPGERAAEPAAPRPSATGATPPPQAADLVPSGPSVLDSGREVAGAAIASGLPADAAAADATRPSGPPGATLALAPGGTERPGQPPPAVPVRGLHVPIGDPRWPEALGAEVRLLVARGIQSARLRLTPEDLGPVEVRIELADDRASVWFGAAHPDTRTALADAMPRLREMFSSAGFDLSDAGVHRDAPREPDPRPDSPAASGGSEAGTAPHLTARVLAAWDRPGLIDEYA